MSKVEDFDNAVPMYGILKCSENYSMTSESLWIIIETK